MILKYVLRNFSRRKVRTILMILSLLVSTGLIVTMSATVETVRHSNVDLIANQVGRYDLAITRPDTSPDPYISIAEISPQILAAEPQITAVYPRFEADIELKLPTAGGDIGQGRLLALDPDIDQIGYIDVIEGSYQLGDGQAALLERTAGTYDLQVGDTVDISYRFPQPREMGQPEAAGASERRSTGRFTISAVVRQDGVTRSGVREGLIIHLEDAQAMLNLPGRAQMLVATVEPALYEASNAEAAALRVRDVVRAVQARLGDEYRYALEKAVALNEAAQMFLVLQALINTYGLMALGVVGLLVHTLVTTNVQEQRRDMAILRILGGQRRILFILVLAEVMVIGIIGVGAGIGLGQLLTQFAVVPLIKQQMAKAGILAPLTPQLSITAVLPAILASFVVLVLSSLQPARQAANTKVMHAINPGVADNIQLEDLARLRERRPDFKLFLIGLALMFIFSLIAGFQAIERFGGPALQAVFIFLALAVMVLGLGFLFFITTVPFERGIIFLTRFVVPRLSYFASRNVGRGEMRNTLISLLVLFSGVLPSFLATQLAMESANFEATVRQGMGAPAEIRIAGYWQPPEENRQNFLPTSFRTEQLAAVPGVARSAGFTYRYSTEVSDPVGFRRATLNVQGVDGNLNEVMFTDLMKFVAGGRQALDALAQDPQAIIISEGLAKHLALGQGGMIRLKGAGTDHFVNVRIIAIARAIPSLGGIGRSRTTAQFGSDALISLDAFRALTTELNQPLPAADAPILDRVKFSLQPGAVPEEMAEDISQRFWQDYHLWPRFLQRQLEMDRRGQATQRIFLLALTLISFTTAIFGVFAVIYVNIFARRIEIGMMKAMGMKRRELTGMLIIESVAMTLGAALAGIVAGASMSYIAFFGERILSQRPASFAVDTTVIPFIAIMVVMASMLGAALSSRRITRKRAVEILRMQ